MKFAEVIGKADIKRDLIQTVKENRVSHAQLFLGAEGSGNLALALAYAQYILCTNKQDNDACGKCPSCIKNQKLIHPDLHFVFPVANIGNKKTSEQFLPEFRQAVLANPYLTDNEWYDSLEMENKQGSISVEDCNEVIKKISLKAYEGGYKIMILWMSERIYHAAAPKLLKTLEEPPEKTLFILVAQNQDLILNTILSRCLLVKIPKYSKQEIIDALKERSNITDEYQLETLANLADGNINKALKLLNADATENANVLEFQNWMRMCYKVDILAINVFVENIAKYGREKQKTFLEYALHILRECLQFNYTKGENLRLTQQEYDFVKNFAKFITIKNVQAIQEELSKTHFHIERNANPRISFMDLSLKMCQFLKLA